MLVIKIINETANDNNIADYQYTVMVNDTIIDFGKIYNHNRNNGWRKLVEMIIEDSRKQEIINEVFSEYKDSWEKLAKL